jgi:hypothetical protein
MVINSVQCIKIMKQFSLTFLYIYQLLAVDEIFIVIPFQFLPYIHLTWFL